MLEGGRLALFQWGLSVAAGGRGEQGWGRWRRRGWCEGFQVCTVRQGYVAVVNRHSVPDITTVVPYSRGVGLGAVCLAGDGLFSFGSAE